MSNDEERQKYGKTLQRAWNVVMSSYNEYK